MLGNAKFNDVQGPRVRDADLSLGKTFSLLEGFKLQFRAEAFNFTNTVSLSLGSSGGGPPPPPGAPGGGGGSTAGITWSPTATAGSVATTAGGFGTHLPVRTEADLLAL
jgi:hypothetical protein